MTTPATTSAASGGNLVAFLGGVAVSGGALYKIEVRQIGGAYEARAFSAAAGAAFTNQGVVKSGALGDVLRAAHKKFSDKLKPARPRVYTNPFPGTTSTMQVGQLGPMVGNDLPLHRLIWQAGRSLDTLPTALHQDAMIVPGASQSAQPMPTAQAGPTPVAPASQAPVAAPAAASAPASAPAPVAAPVAVPVAALAAAAGDDFPFPLMIINPNDIQSEPELLATIPDNGWVWTEKKEGHRLLAGKTPDGRIVGKSKSWRDVDLPAEIAAVFTHLAPGTWLDGELLAEDDQGRAGLYAGGAAVHQRYYVFDVIVTPLLPDTPAHWYDSRLNALRTIVRGLGQQDLVRIIPTAVGAAAKQRMLREVRARNGEGFVLRKNDSPYVNGRPNTCLRWRDRAREADVVAMIYDPASRAWGFANGVGKQTGMVGAVTVGLFDEQGVLQSLGELGSGWSDADRQDLQRRWDAARADLAALKQTAGAAGVSQSDMDAFLARHRFVVRAHCMGLSFNGKMIRASAVRGPSGSPIRPANDKQPAECTFASERLEVVEAEPMAKAA
jgi:bifunctional non-homologous end joining protein LigD